MAPSLGIESLSSNSTLRNRAHLFTAELVFLCHRRAMCLECKEENKFQVIIQRACPPSIASQERAEKMGRTHGVGSQELARHRQVFSAKVVGLAVCCLPADAEGMLHRHRPVNCWVYPGVSKFDETHNKSLGTKAGASPITRSFQSNEQAWTETAGWLQWKLLWKLCSRNSKRK